MSAQRDLRGDPMRTSPAGVFLRPLGSPLPLGMIALAGASVLLTGQQLSWVPAGQSHDLALAVLVFAVPMQYLASVFGFLSRDSAGGTGMALLGSCWLVTGSLLLLTPPGSRSPALGLLLFFASGALLVPVAAAAFGKLAAALAFLLAAARFAVTGVQQYVGGAAWQHAAGWLGLAVCVVALYSAFAFELEDTRHHTVLPVLRWGSGRRAMDGSLPDEVHGVQHEAGVRRQL
jgi:uncharacterized protein